MMRNRVASSCAAELHRTCQEPRLLCDAWRRCDEVWHETTLSLLAVVLAVWSWAGVRCDMKGSEQRSAP